jgi:hypothetical protein
MSSRSGWTPSTDAHMVAAGQAADDTLFEAGRSQSSARRARADAPSPSASPPLTSTAVVPPLMLPRPPESARPSTSGGNVKPASAVTSVVAAAPRPNTATGPAPHRHPQPPAGSKAQLPGVQIPPASVAAAPAASPGGTGAPAVSHYAVGKTIGEGQQQDRGEKRAAAR